MSTNFRCWKPKEKKFDGANNHDIDFNKAIAFKSYEHSHKAVLQQCLMVKDMFGLYVFEGDILYILEDLEGDIETNLREVIVERSGLSWTIRDTNCNLTEQKELLEEHVHEDLRQKNLNIAVAGNIFQGKKMSSEELYQKRLKFFHDPQKESVALNERGPNV